MKDGPFMIDGSPSRLTIVEYSRVPNLQYDIFGLDITVGRRQAILHPCCVVPYYRHMYALGPSVLPRHRLLAWCSVLKQCS